MQDNGEMFGEVAMGDLVAGKGLGWKGKWEIFCRVIDQSGAGAGVPEIEVFPLWFHKSKLSLKYASTVRTKVKAFSFTKIAAANNYFPIPS